MSRELTGLEAGLADYIGSLVPDDGPVARALRERTASLPMARMQISPEQAQFMRLLLRLIGARQTIEIGVFTGYSTLITAECLPADGRVVACDVSKEWTDIGRQHWQRAGVAERIDLRLAPAAETLRALIDDGQAGEFDFAFIDADKTGYAEYYELCLQLVRPRRPDRRRQRAVGRQRHRPGPGRCRYRRDPRTEPAHRRRRAR